MVSVLIVDDDPNTRRMVREVLELEGYTVSTAEHGGPALGQMRASPVPLLVLLGLMMPVVTGEQVLEEVAADTTLAARHRIIMITGAFVRASQGRVAELRRQLDVPLLSQPVKVAELLPAVEAAVASLSKRREQERQARTSQASEG
jgi:CheY-like chemotaxis protein